MSWFPPCLRPLGLISSLAIFDFVGTGTADRPDEQDLQFKITLIPTFDLNMNDSSWIVSVNVINIAHGASGGMSQPYIIRDRTSLAWCADINSDKQSLFCDELIQ
jgi:hypothetical protein